MDCVVFFNKLKSEDSRIRFNINNDEKKLFRADIPEFYRKVDPLEVEFEYNDGIIRLIPFDELDSIQEKYSFVEDGCIFALCNGDPIYYKNSKVWICMRGKNKIIEEEIALSIDNFFTL